MSKKLKEIDIKKSCMLLFQWRGEYKNLDRKKIKRHIKFNLVILDTWWSKNFNGKNIWG